MIEDFHNGVRRLRMRQLSSPAALRKLGHDMGGATGYSPLGAYSSPAPAAAPAAGGNGTAATATNPPMSPVPMWTPAPWSPAPAVDVYSKAPAAYVDMVPYPAAPVSTGAPLPMMTNPPPVVNLTDAFMDGPGNDGEITVATIIDHNMFNGTVRE